MNKIKFHLLSRCALACLFMCSSLMLSAQTDSLNMSVTFDGNRINLLNDASKLPNTPNPFESIVEIPTIKYTLIPNKQQVDIVPAKIKPVKVNVEEKIAKLYRGYIKAGFGLYTTPLVDLYYTDGRSRDGTWGVKYQHLSSAGGVALEDSIKDRFSSNEINLWGRRFLKKHALQGNFDWKRNVFNYYGWDPELMPFSADSLDLQLFNRVGGSLNLKSYHRDSSKVNYEGQVGFFNYRDNFESSENNIDIQAHVRRFVDKELFSVDLKFNYDQFQFIPLDNLNDKMTEVNSIFGIEPKASTIHENWKVSAGMGIWLDIRSKNPFHFYPLLEAEYSLFDDLFIPYGGVSGGIKQNTFRALTEENPWLLRSYEQLNTNRKLELYGGIRGTISSSTSFNARISRTRFEDFVFFVNDSSHTGGNQLQAFGIGNGFDIEYDDLTVTSLSGEISINSKKDFKLFAKGDYFIYTGQKIEEEPWNQPTTRLTLSGSYDFRNKLIVRLDLFTVGQRKAKSLVPLTADDALLTDKSFYEYKLKGYGDANLGIEYRYTKRLSAWVQFNNFLAAKYETYKNYRAQRFNAMMGVSYAF